MSIAEDINALITEDVQRKKLRILTLDIETSPSLAYVWSIWQENIPLDRLIETGSVLCVTAKWYGEDELLFFSDYHNGHEEMIYEIWDLIDEADVIVHYNGRAFDMKHLNKEFFLLELTPPSPYKQIDLLTVVRSVFKFQSNKLDHIVQQLGIGAKVKHKGFQLWVDCMNGVAEAWEEMRTYNLQDVVITEKLYTKVIPWIKNHPTIAIINDLDELVCPRCGSTNLRDNGVQQVQMYEYPAYVCNDCNGHLKGKESTRIANLKTI